MKVKYIIQILHAGLDRNGNSRKGFVAWKLWDENSGDDPPLPGSLQGQRQDARFFGPEGLKAAIEQAGFPFDNCFIIPRIDVSFKELKEQIS